MRLQRGRALVTPCIISCDLSLSGHSQAALPLPHVKASFTAEALASARRDRCRHKVCQRLNEPLTRCNI